MEKASLSGALEVMRQFAEKTLRFWAFLAEEEYAGMVVWRVYNMAVMGWPMISCGNETTKREGDLVLEGPACRRRNLGHSTTSSRKQVQEVGE